MTPVPPTQPPAAPEGEVRLTEAIERGLRKCRVEDAPAPLIKEHDLFHVTHMVAAELAPLLEATRERVRVVEGERDDIADRLSALLCDLTGGRMSKTGYSVSTMIQAVEAEFEKHATEDTAALVAEHQWNALERAREADLATARAESAEAALAELRAGVEVLAERDKDGPLPRRVITPDALRALLGGAS